MSAPYFTQKKLYIPFGILSVGLSYIAGGVIMVDVVVEWILNVSIILKHTARDTTTYLVVFSLPSHFPLQVAVLPTRSSSSPAFIDQLANRIIECEPLLPFFLVEFD
jgi:hypothetical protein